MMTWGESENIDGLLALPDIEKTTITAKYIILLGISYIRKRKAYYIIRYKLY